MVLFLLQWFYAACTLPACSTGAGQDLMLVAGPDSDSSYIMEADTRKWHTVPSCKGAPGEGQSQRVGLAADFLLKATSQKRTCCCNLLAIDPAECAVRAAVTGCRNIESYGLICCCFPAGPCVSVHGKAFMLGRHGSAAVSCFDPCVNCWFQSAQMPAGGMYDFAAVSPAGSSAVLTFGGVDSSTGRHRDGIAVYDTRCRAWNSSPSGLALPRPSRGLAAAALDAHRVLLFGGSGGCEAYMLEMRMWQLQQAGQLSHQRQHLAGVLLSGSVLALGGEGEHEEYLDMIEVYDAARNCWSPAGHLPCPMSHMAAAEADVSTALHVGQPRTM